MEKSSGNFLSFLVALGCVMKDSSSLYRAASLDFAVHDDDDNEKITSVGGDELNSLCLSYACNNISMVVVVGCSSMLHHLIFSPSLFYT